LTAGALTELRRDNFPMIGPRCRAIRRQAGSADVTLIAMAPRLSRIRIPYSRSMFRLVAAEISALRHGPIQKPPAARRPTDEFLNSW